MTEIVIISGLGMIIRKEKFKNFKDMMNDDYNCIDYLDNEKDLIERTFIYEASTLTWSNLILNTNKLDAKDNIVKTIQNHNFDIVLNKMTSKMKRKFKIKDDDHIAFWTIMSTLNLTDIKNTLIKVNTGCDVALLDEEKEIKSKHVDKKKSPVKKKPKSKSKKTDKKKSETKKKSLVKI